MKLFESFQRVKQTNENVNNIRSFEMRDHYDFSESVPNPYAKKLKKQITIRLDEDVIEYFKQLADKNGIPYQNLINLYLKDCATAHKELQLNWQ